MNEIDFPTAEEKQRAILMAFQNGAHLTVQICFRMYHTTELRKVVTRLRRQGYNIVGEKLDGKNYKTYWLLDAIN
jgi:ACT domain-containing protein